LGKLGAALLGKESGRREGYFAGAGEAGVGQRLAVSI
jgi:hypothetical protein